MGALGPEQQKELRYQVAYHTYLASGRQLSYTPNVEHVVGWKYAKRSLFGKFSDCIMFMWEKIPGSPHFSALQAMESWAGPGNEMWSLSLTTPYLLYYDYQTLLCFTAHGNEARFSWDFEWQLAGCYRGFQVGWGNGCRVAKLSLCLIE